MANYYYQQPQPAGSYHQNASFYPFSSNFQQGSQYQDNHLPPPPPPQDGYRQDVKDNLFSNSNQTKSRFDHGESPTEEWMGAGVKAYRKGIRPRNLWKRGGGFSIFGRCFFCSVMIIVYIVLASILAIALWLRPPALSFTPPGLNPNQAVNLGTNLTVPLELNITINNPNFFSADFRWLTAEVSYPDVENEVVARGNLTKLVLESNKITNFTFPIDISLDLSGQADANDLKIVTDLASKCGIFPQGSQKTPIPLSIKIGIAIEVLGIKFSIPSISFTVRINCPIDDSAIQQKLQGILGFL
ncbi:hypothetical protein D9757_004102 [Collybiopsis confluens]|uniref:Late embryogenesis abundant protein LEA-2 subgroup domain-containing protein n=1 Tax=Collybiopsis confluens TaxID=2823264 RepID=A0A8H5HUK5_9AGAR|nr:hypothetical protein D9757_004102 [Collybiopsis confluens]